MLMLTFIERLQSDVSAYAQHAALYGAAFSKVTSAHSIAIATQLLKALAMLCGSAASEGMPSSSDTAATLEAALAILYSSISCVISRTFGEYIAPLSYTW